MKTLLLPGGLGYIGSHTIIEILQQRKTKIVIIDDYSNCQQDVTDRLFEILDPEHQGCIVVKKGNILDYSFVESVFQQQKDNGTPIEGIIHFAAKKNATESVLVPMLYFENNVTGSMNLLKAMEKFPECNKFLFSSTAAVYG